MARLRRASEPDVLKPSLERTRPSPESRRNVPGHAAGLLGGGNAMLVSLDEGGI